MTKKEKVTIILELLHEHYGPTKPQDLMFTPCVTKTTGASLTKFDNYAPRNANYQGFTD